MRLLDKGYQPVGYHMCISSPTSLPKAAPMLKTGMKLPLGTGIVELMIEKMNCKERELNHANLRAFVL